MGTDMGIVLGGKDVFPGDYHCYCNQPSPQPVLTTSTSKPHYKNQIAWPKEILA